MCVSGDMASCKDMIEICMAHLIRLRNFIILHICFRPCPSYKEYDKKKVPYFCMVYKENKNWRLYQ